MLIKQQGVASEQMTTKSHTCENPGRPTPDGSRFGPKSGCRAEVLNKQKKTIGKAGDEFPNTEIGRAT